MKLTSEEGLEKPVSQTDSATSGTRQPQLPFRTKSHNWKREYFFFSWRQEFQ
jgi:hypothetical protein